MLSQFPKDIVPIIYKYIHKSNVDECNREYREKFMPEWDETRNYFESRNEGDFLLNYRKWDINKYQNIYNMWIQRVVGQLPKNY